MAIDQKLDLERDHSQLTESIRRAFWYRYFKFLLDLHDYDIQGVYKISTPKNEEGQQISSRRSIFQRQSSNKPDVVGERVKRTDHKYESSELRRPVTEANWRRRWLTLSLRIYVCYSLLKGLMVSFAHYTLLKHENLVPKGYRQPWLSLESANAIFYWFGNPLYPLKESAIVLYTTPIGLCVICFAILPRRYTRKPLDISSIRFLQDPCRELKRVNLDIEKKLRLMSLSLAVYRHQKQLELANQCRCSSRESVVKWGFSGRNSNPILPSQDFAQLIELIKVEDVYCTQIGRFISELRLCISSLRPGMYSLDYFLEAQKKLALVHTSISSLYEISTLILTALIIVSTYAHKCRDYRARLSDPSACCDSLHIFTSSEMLLLVEVICGVILCTFVAILNGVLLVIASSGKTQLICEMERELESCKNFVRSNSANKFMGDTRQAITSTSTPKAQETIKSGGSEEGLLQESPNEWAQSRLTFDRRLLESLIRLMVCEEELKVSSQSISELTFYPFYNAGSGIILTLFNAQLKLSESASVRRFVVVVIWLMVNASTILCAHVHARTLKLERSMWRVLAANAATYQDQGAQASGASEPSATPRRDAVRSCTLVTDLWIKFALAINSNINRYCARFLNVRLTYEMIIELNFFAIFAYSLVVGLS